jgi:hypothetical protein
MLDIDYLKPFGYKCYGYVNPKSLPANKRTNKLIMPGRLSVFIRYSKETTKQVKIYIPDLEYIIKVIRVDFEEEILSGTINLMIKGAKPQGTTTALPQRQPVGRPKETLTDVELPYSSQLNNF